MITIHKVNFFLDYVYKNEYPMIFIVVYRNKYLSFTENINRFSPPPDIVEWKVAEIAGTEFNKEVRTKAVYGWILCFEHIEIEVYNLIV